METLFEKEWNYLVAFKLNIIRFFPTFLNCIALIINKKVIILIFFFIIHTYIVQEQNNAPNEAT